MLVFGLVAPLLTAMALCTIGSIYPVRLDHRALQDLLRLQNTSLPQSSGDFVFLSRDNSIESARAATFGLKQLTFPNGSIYWVALKEQCTGPWTSTFLGVDADGNLFAPAVNAASEMQWRAALPLSIEDQRRMVQQPLVFDSRSTQASFEQRWPFLKQAGNIVVLSEAPQVTAFALRRPANEFTLTRIVRITTIMGSYLAIVLVLYQLNTLKRLNAGFIWGGAVFLAVGVNLWLTYLLQWILPGSVQWGSLMLWLGLLVLAYLLANHQKDQLPISRPHTVDVKLPQSTKLFLLYGVFAYTAVFLIRLDFDGDFFNNWLPQGRFHYLLGRHDPSAIISQGFVQAASYPPGYGILLSKLMWASGMNPVASFLIGADSSFAILLYRLLILALNLALFLILGIYLSRLDPYRSRTWLAFLLLTMLLLPTTAGAHIASETLLLPMLGAAIVMIAAGRNLQAPGLTTMGVMVGGTATLIKWEAALLLTLAVLPWLAVTLYPGTEKLSRAVRVTWIGVLFAGLLPMFVWKAKLQVQNEFFVPVTWSRLMSSMPNLPGLAKHALRLLFDDGRLMLLLFGLPGAILLRFRRRPRWSTLLAPLCAVSLFVGWVVVFLFTDNAPQTYLLTSYSRLVMVPTFGLILYCAEALQSRHLSRALPAEA